MLMCSVSFSNMPLGGDEVELVCDLELLDMVGLDILDWNVFEIFLECIEVFLEHLC